MPVRGLPADATAIELANLIEVIVDRGEVGDEFLQGLDVPEPKCFAPDIRKYW
jgi:hypothetical protein